ncbi:MAG: InlB B-repeat-containing protein [Erysipelotrichaceae bacterium]|nr:InlB B-repeat-containing protein [Erysipelotrichaceae bacterium]
MYVHDNAYNASLFGEYSITINVNDSYRSDKPAIFLQSGDVAAGTLLGMSLDGYIYYTTDGTDPTTSSNLYVDSIPITEDVTIKVVGYYYGYPLSEVTTLIYRVIRGVSYDVGTIDSGTSPIDDTEYFSGDIAIIKGIDGISNPGYEFKGWNAQADGNGTYYQPNNAYIITNKSLSLYAIWETQQVSFNSTDLADCTFLQDYYYAISATGGSGSYTYERISGFLPEGLTATQLEGSSELVIQGKPTLYYPMYMPVFKVTDNYNHTTATANCVIRMNTAGKLTAPVANYASGEVEKGSTFSLTANEGENILYSIDGGESQYYYSPITIDRAMVISYYVEKSGYDDSDVESASFTLKNHSVNYITGTSDTLVDPQTYNYGDTAVAYGIGAITNQDKLFIGWSLEENGEVYYHGGDNFSILDHDINLYAVWVNAKITVTFVDTTGETIKIDEIDYGTSPELPEVPSREGYNFFAWFTKSDLSEYYSGYELYEDTTLYGEWSVIVCTIHFDTQGGNQIDDEYVNYGDDATLPDEPTRLGYTFVGWYTSTGYNTRVNFTHVTEDITAYALWVVARFEVTFDSNGGTTVDNIPVEYGNPITAPTDPTKEGYTFVGWYLSLTDTQPYDFSTKIYSSFTLIAKWTVNSYTLTIDVDGQITTVEVDYGSTMTIPSDPTKDGYVFEGWYLDSGFTKPLTETNMPAQPVTIYAKFVSAAQPFDFVLLLWIIIIILALAALSTFTIIKIKHSKRKANR